MIKIKENGKKLALVWILGISGCGPALMGIGAAAPGARGAVLSAFGAGVTQIEAAQAGKDEINQKVEVYPRYQSTNQKVDWNTPWLNLKAFVCKNAQDLDGSGYISYPFEFRDICTENNNLFFKDEIINLVLEVPPEPRHLKVPLDVVIFDKDNKYLVYKSNTTVKCGFDAWFIERTCAERLKDGEYNVYWTAGGGRTILGQTKFRIAERNPEVPFLKYKLSPPPLNTN